MKIVYSIICLFLAYSFAQGQCIPDTSITHNQPGTYPDTITGLPHGIVGQAYATVIQVKVLTDSTVGGLTGVVDSIVVTNVTGLPGGFTYSCNPVGCSFPGGSNGCIDLTGPAPSVSGTYPLVVQSIIYYKILGTPQTLQNDISGYKIVVDPFVGFSTVEKNVFSAGQNIPNPAKDYVTIPVTLPNSDEVSITVSNLIGKKVFSHSYSLQKGKTNIPLDVRELQAGIYLYTVSSGKNTVTRRMILSKD